MTDPITFPSGTPNAGLPLLFAGQIQKEFYVNQTFAIIDALTSGAVVASLAEPPVYPEEGACYRILGTAVGDWSQRRDHLAVRIAGGWHFIAPLEGMHLHDRSAGHWIYYRSGWLSFAAPTVPTGGSTVDIEARAALAQLVESLQSIGIIAPPAI